MNDEYHRNELVDIAGIAMDNVHDMDVTISDYAEAAVDAILASNVIQTARDDALVAALRFYADEISYMPTQIREPTTAVHGDAGRRARQALKGSAS